MSTWDPDNDVLLTDSEDEEFIAMKRDYTGREALLFVVDANLYDTPEHFMTALKVVRGAFISGLLVNDKDLVGLLFANTKLSPPPFENDYLEKVVVPDHCALFMPLRQLTKPVVEHFMHFLLSVDDTFLTDYGNLDNGGHGNFAAMIRLCIQLFDKCGVKLNNAKIAYMTNRETPHPPHSNEFQAALQKANDLEGKEIEFHVIPMVDDFDYDIFYKEFLTLSRAIEIDSFQVPDARVLRDILEDRKLKQDFLRRCLGHFNFELGPNVKISSQYYNYFQSRSLPKKVKISRENNCVLKQKRIIMVRSRDSETLQVVHEHQVKHTDGWHEIKLGGRPIRITSALFNRVRNLHSPGMKLLGFKHRSVLPEIFFIKPANFMYPDDQNIIGSKRLFRALWQRCLEREKIAICLFMSKRKSPPRYVALVPVEAAKDAGNGNYKSLLSGDGFKIVYLPAAKNIRNNDLSAWNAIENTSPDEGVAFFNKVSRKLSIDYHPSLINDPTLENLNANLLALSLDIKLDGTDESLMPDAKLQDERLKSFLSDYDKIFGVETEIPKKRVANSNGVGALKMLKIDDEALKEHDFIDSLIKNESLMSCTVSQLRYILDEHFKKRMPQGATKSVIVERIKQLDSERKGKQI